MSVVQGRVRARAAGAVVARRALLAGSGLLGRAADPAQVAWWALRGAPRRESAARRALGRIDGLVTPTPADVVGAYLRGSVLLGVPGPGDVRFEYRRDEVRSVITAESKHVPKRLRALERRLGLQVRVDDGFAEVVQACRREDFTWITDDVVQLYQDLFDAGLASSISVHQQGEAVGGLWGISLGRTFGIMSVFHRVDHAGSMAQLALLDRVGADERWDLVDVGMPRPHYDRLGAHAVPVDRFTGMLLADLGRLAAAVHGRVAD